MVDTGSRVFRFVWRRRTLVVALSAIYGMVPPAAQANPGGAAVVHGQATLQTQGKTLTVTNTPGAIINWQQFSIGAGETTYFQQQSAASTVLNRVQAQNPVLKSQIDGTLGSNGKVFLINPNGVVFGPGSVIDTQGFVASTLSMNDADFKAGKFKFARDGMAGDIQVQGRISSGNGDVYLIAPNVRTDGTAVITSQGGDIVLAAGEMVEITGRNLNDITFEVQSPGNQAVNLGRLEGGAVGVFAGTLRHSGEVQAQTVMREGGRLVLRAQGDVVLGAGSRGSADGANQGGVVEVASLNGNIQMHAGARISAVATAAAAPSQATPRGGSVTVQAASGYLSMDAGASIDASGGRGGSVVVQTDRMAQSGAVRADGRDTLGGSVSLQVGSRLIQDQSAEVSARGALRGGTVELLVDADVAGHGNLYSSARIDASAGSGIGGSVTLTGRDISLAAAQVSADGDAGGGTIRIGGGRAGQDDSVANAQTVFANAAVRVQADARVDGDGGTIVAWADGVNRVAGQLQARGGPLGGDGGFIEVSGKAETQFGGLADASSTYGKAGTFLLDPKFIVIQASAVIPGVSVELVDPNPGNNNFFGQTMQLLGGNILILNPNDDFAGSNSGAAYQFDGNTGALLSSLRGSSAGDQVGSGGLQFLSGGAYVIRSPAWNASAGALTWTNGVAPLGGTLGASNSLVGAAAGDLLASGGFQNLFNGKYAVFTPNWSNGKGAVTWFDATGGTTTGAVASTNSLVGSTDGDAVGSGGLVNFFTGKGVIQSPDWNGSAGAYTFVPNLAVGITGPIDGTPVTGNSLVGAAAGDQIGSGGFYSLNSGHYVLVSPDASINGVGSGAVTWYNTTSGVIGPISSANSLLGGSAGDAVGSDGIETVGFAGNYLIRSPLWNGGRGALTFAAGNGPITGTPDVVTSAVGNSILGSTPGDGIGGSDVESLFYSSGNFLVIHPNWSNAGAANAGAVTWGSGATGFGSTAVVSAANSIVGAAPGDDVGSGGITHLYSGNVLVHSPDWGGGAGAVSFVSGNSLTAGTVSSADTFSIVGAVATDNVGSGGTTVFYDNSGNFVVLSPNWSNGGATQAGAVTWGHQTTGFSAPGLITSSNSLVGANAGDRVGSGGITESFSTGNYMVASPSWSGGRGAVSFGLGDNLIAGVVGASDGLSIVGGATTDAVGSLGVVELGNGHFLVRSPDWSTSGGVLNVGAVTWADATTGFASPGLIDSSNSLVGTNAGDRVGSGGVLEVGYSGNYLIRSPNWDGTRGALTFAVGNAPITGSPDAVTSTDGNSLLGVFAGESIGGGNVQTLFNSGNFVVRHINWANTPSVPNAGAVTWGSGDTGFGTTANVSAANSLIGSASGDQVGSGGIVELGSGNFLVRSPNWSGGAGAVSFASGTSATGAIVSSSDGVSMVGGDPSDALGSSGISELSSGHFLVRSPNWKNGVATQAGAVTWGDANAGFASPGLVSAANSVFGSSPNDRVGNSFTTLNNGNFVLLSPNWDNGAATDAGAVTWGDANTGFIAMGAISSANSLVGTQSNDQVGSSGLQQLFINGFSSSGMYLVRSPQWSNAGATQAGAVTWFDQNIGITGEVNATTSLVGSNAGDLIGSGFMAYSTASGQVMRNASWNGGRGALTFIPIASGLVGTVGAGNSFVGTSAGDNIGSGGVTTIDGGIVAINSPNWSNGAATSAGAVTWVNTASASAGFIGSVTPANSLFGSSANDQVGSSGVSSVGGGATPLYAVRSPLWDDGGLSDVGAITWASSASLPTGPVSASNSLVGSTASDRVGQSSSFNGNSAFNYVLVSNTNWNGNRGAVSWMNRATPLTGAISSANSLVGSSANDVIGSSGVGFFGNGSYYVLSPGFGSSAGALSVGSAAGGITGVVSGANSLVGQNPGDGYGLFSTLTGNRLLVRASNADSLGFSNNGRVHIYAGGAGGGSGPSGALGGQAFSDNSGTAVTITPQQILAILNTGTNLQLQANSDITLAALSDIFVNNPSGNGGNFTLQAGRSVLLLSSIGTDGGNLTIIGNELTSNGVLTAHRDPGIAEIVMANGTRLDAGTGTVTLHLRDGAGRTGLQSAAGLIQLRSIRAGTLVTKTDTGSVVIGGLAATAPSEIVVLGNADIIAKTSVSLFGGVAGAQALLSADGQITIASPNPATDPAPVLTLTNGGSRARIVNPPATLPLILSGSECIGCVVVSPFEITGADDEILDRITAAILTRWNPSDPFRLPGGKKDEDDIMVDVGETCQ